MFTLDFYHSRSLVRLLQNAEYKEKRRVINNDKSRHVKERIDNS